MLNQYIEEVLDGYALLEDGGELYECVGHKNGKFVFQNAYGDDRMELSYETLRMRNDFGIQANL